MAWRSPVARRCRVRFSSPARTRRFSRSRRRRPGRAPRCWYGGSPSCSTACALSKERRTRMAEVDLQRILRLLPHRYPFLMIDRVRELEPKKRVIAIKNVSNNEPQFQGHFPGRPIMPGVLILEAFAQAAVVMML